MSIAEFFFKRFTIFCHFSYVAQCQIYFYKFQQLSLTTKSGTKRDSQNLSMHSWEMKPTGPYRQPPPSALVHILFRISFEAVIVVISKEKPTIHNGSERNRPSARYLFIYVIKVRKVFPLLPVYKYKIYFHMTESISKYFVYKRSWANKNFTESIRSVREKLQA